MQITTLNTSRLVIRRYVSDDLPARLRLIHECFDRDSSPEKVREWLDWTVLAYEGFARLYQPPYADYAVTLPDGTPVGSVGLVPSLIPWAVLDGGQDPRISPEFGLFWAVLPEQQGQGYATEAGAAMIDFVFATLKARRVVATTEHDNLRSIRVMERLGMTIRRNPGDDPPRLQVVGVLENPAITA